MNAPFAQVVSAPAGGPTYRSRAGLAFDVRLEPTTRHITARGQLDCSSVAALSDIIGGLVELEPSDVTVDLSRVTFVDAAVMGCLVGFGHRLATLGYRLVMTGATPRVRRVFAIVDLSELLDVA